MQPHYLFHMFCPASHACIRNRSPPWDLHIWQSLLCDKGQENTGLANLIKNKNNQNKTEQYSEVTDNQVLYSH